MKHLAIIMALVLLAVAPAGAAGPKPAKPSPQDKCPVCGMFVAKYPDFVAQLIFRDGSHAYFDGVKDLMKYHFDLAKYNPSKKTADIAAIFVTDYYTLELIDGLQAWYVMGSEVFGPMGKELVPFRDETAAREFLKDHAGKSLLRFNGITADLVKTLD